MDMSAKKMSKGMWMYKQYDGEWTYCPPITWGSSDCDDCHYEKRGWCPWDKVKQ